MPLIVKVGWRDKPVETIEAIESWREDNVIFVRLLNGLTKKIPEQLVRWCFTKKGESLEEAVNKG